MRLWWHVQQRITGRKGPMTSPPGSFGFLIDRLLTILDSWTSETFDRGAKVLGV